MSGAARPALLMTLVLSLLACGSPRAASDGDSAAGRPLHLPSQEIEETVGVTLPDGTRVVAELADDPEEIRIGLMGREEVPPGTGMLFVFPERGHRAFWMKNCLVSLDIAWLSRTPEGGRVVHLEPELPPCLESRCPSYSPLRAADYVLELGAGQASAHGVLPGREVRFELPRASPEEAGTGTSGGS